MSGDTTMTCDHDEDKRMTFVSATTVHEIYMCECGALLNYMDPENYDRPFRAMTAAQLDAALKEELVVRFDNLKDAISEAIRKELG